MTDYCNRHMHHHHEDSCDCACGCKCGCGSPHHHHHHEEGSCNCAEKFLAIADEAWREVLKEKIKAKILEHKGDNIDKLAEIIAMANGEKWKHIISAKTKCNNFKETLKEFFTSND